MRHPYVPSVPELRGWRRSYVWVGFLMLLLTLLPAPFADAGLLGYLR
jgi:hypothetical protein